MKKKKKKHPHTQNKTNKQTPLFSPSACFHFSAHLEIKREKNLFSDESWVYIKHKCTAFYITLIKVKHALETFR